MALNFATGKCISRRACWKLVWTAAATLLGRLPCVTDPRATTAPFSSGYCSSGLCRSRWMRARTNSPGRFCTASRLSGRGSGILLLQGTQAVS